MQRQIDGLSFVVFVYECLLSRLRSTHPLPVLILPMKFCKLDSEGKQKNLSYLRIIVFVIQVEWNLSANTHILKGM
jgi:hypothetical protein